jgi:metal-responsive CopG/Arc/MetJ family transcriptional regulator
MLERVDKLLEQNNDKRSRLIERLLIKYIKENTDI